MSKPTLSVGAFTALPFAAVTLGRVNNFIVAGLPGSPPTIRWCAIGNPTDWPTPLTDDARAKQAGDQEFPTKYGTVTGIAGDDFFGYVLMEKGIAKMSYVGGDIVFAFDVFEEERGCLGINRYVHIEDTVFYQSEFGYHALTRGGVQNIGFGVVDDAYPPNVATTGPQKNVVANPAISTVFFEDNSLAYNYRTNQWTRVPALAPATGQTLFDLHDSDGIIGRAIPGWTLATPRTGVDFQNQSAGVVSTATIETGEADINQGGRASVDGVRPLTNGGTVSVRVGVRNALSDSVVYATGTSINSRTGLANFRNADNRAEGRYQRLRCQITGGFTTAMGADIEFSPSGKI